MSKIDKLKPEPLVIGEQGVVYLFSKYWEKIPALTKNIHEMRKVQTRFPDAIYINNNGKLGGIEFETALSGFEDHYTREIKCEYSCGWKEVVGIKGFIDQYKPSEILIVYWEVEDIKRTTITKEIRKINRNIAVKFVDLSKYFYSSIVDNTPMLKFGQSKNQMFENIGTDYSKLVRSRFVREFPNDEENNIRIIGYNPAEADDIPLGMWSNMKYFSTSSRIKKVKFNIFILKDPNDNFLLVKPKHAFRYSEKGNKRIKEFHNKYYLSGRLSDWDDFTEPYFVIYEKCKFLAKDQGGSGLKRKILRSKRNSKFHQGGYTIYKDAEEKLFKQIWKIFKESD